ncbi:monovalent cation/H(+) antiporter subunit G [Roseibium denhamense]|uniref:Multicomponent Na+:H+ antiporter subunit G n=1 Tax=Roseibium denhamense TaxID=76305 RepID=A0ABY1N6R3_9HYPH|nr:monovalent cation/H(+) antiporter subunit G [Roseibium denhamense]MTI04010.1 monovalent cation/H(+) antiporter subunit G [Roseibium denhamense]SMP00991.1 multicomponent Na+:H+ antiporter subunit G [Roseibium denhamense]
MTAVVAIITGIMLIIGALFALIASIGLLRLKDVYMRTHAASKAGTLGSGLMLLALALYAGDASVVTRAIAGVVFFLLTAPIAAHLLAKAAYEAGYQPCADTKIDALKETLPRKS